MQAGLDELRRFATSSLKCPDCGASIDRKSGEATRASKRGRPAVDRVIDLDEAESSAAASGKVFDLADDDSDGDGSDADQSGAERGGVVCVDEGEEEAAAGAALSQRSATAPQHDDDDDDDDGVVALDDSDDEGGAAPAAHGGVSLRTPRDAAPPPSVPADPADGGGADGGDVDNADARDDEASRSPSSAAAGATTTRAAAAAAAASTAPQLVLESSRTAPVIVCSVCSCRVLATSGAVARGAGAGRFVVPTRQAVAALLDRATATATEAKVAPKAAVSRRKRAPSKPTAGGAAAAAAVPNSTAYSGEANDAEVSSAAVAAARRRQEAEDVALGEAFKGLCRALPCVSATAEGASIAHCSAAELVAFASRPGLLRLPPAAAIAADSPLLLALLEARASDVGPPAIILPGSGAGPVEGSAWVAAAGDGESGGAAPSRPGRRPKRGRPSSASRASEAKAAAAAGRAAERLRVRLVDVVCPLLRTSMQDMASRTALYFPLLSACEAIAGCPATAPLLVWAPPDDEPSARGSDSQPEHCAGRAMTHFAALVAWRLRTRPMSPADVSSSAPAGSIAALLQTLSDAATLYCRTADAALEATADDATAFAADEAEQYTRVRVLAGRARSSVATVRSGLLIAAGRLILTSHAAGACIKWAQVPAKALRESSASTLPPAAAAAVSAAGGGGVAASGGAKAARAAGKTGEDSSPWIARVAFSPSDEAVAEYKRRMRPHAFAMVPRLAAAHAFRKSAAQSASRKQLKRLMRVATELSALPTTALEWASSVLARSDEARMDLVRVAVLGPADTPYMNGVALVDLMLPASYPDVPPQASFVSTAGGTVRFNPNLYANGKVCLSLLGTWTGPSWSPGQSTLAQVLLAIQGQIMNSNPWLNEPGFPAVPQLCSQYNCVLRLATLQHLILAPLRSPPPLFRQAVLTHFTLKQHELREQCASWTAEAARLARLQKGPCACQRYSVFPSDSPFNSSLMSVSIATRAACDQIRQLLDKLPPLSDEPC